jgi:hypothetical protein
MSSTKNRFEINGYIDTNKSVLENIEELGTACNTWVTNNNTSSTATFVFTISGGNCGSANKPVWGTCP